MKQIIAANTGTTALVDDCDFDLVKLNWSENRRKHFVCRIKNRTILLHRLIAARAKVDLTNYIDHRNNNPLDNRRSNLRSATNQQNQFNTNKQINNTSGFKGVTWDRTYRRFLARIRYGKSQRKHLGSFKSAKEAAMAYNNAAIKLHGQFARLNKIT